MLASQPAGVVQRSGGAVRRRFEVLEAAMGAEAIRKLLQQLDLVKLSVVLREELRDTGSKQKKPPLIQCSLRGFSAKPSTRPPSPNSATPHCRCGRTTVIVARSPCRA